MWNVIMNVILCFFAGGDPTVMMFDKGDYCGVIMTPKLLVMVLMSIMAVICLMMMIEMASMATIDEDQSTVMIMKAVMNLTVIILINGAFP
jgi:hypothetical protein